MKNLEKTFKDKNLGKPNFEKQEKVNIQFFLILKILLSRYKFTLLLLHIPKSLSNSMKITHKIQQKIQQKDIVYSKVK